MTDQSGSTDPTVPLNKPFSMINPSPEFFSILSSMFCSFGPDGQYSKAVRKGDIKVKPKLGADNYLTWTEKMWIQLKSMRVLRLVKGKIPQPDERSRPKDFDEWDHNDTNALKWIQANCEKTQLTYLQNKKTLQAAGEALKKVYGVYAKRRIVYLLKQFYTYRAGPTNTIDDIAGALETLQIQIADIKPEYKPHDILIAVALISAVEDTAFDTVKALLEQDSELTLETAKKALKRTEQRIKIELKDVTIEEAH